LKEIRRVAGLGREGWLAVPELAEQLRRPDAAVRYWAIVVAKEVLKTQRPSEEELRKNLDPAELSKLESVTPRSLFARLLKDDSPAVRVAAAHAQLQFGDDSDSLERLTRELASPHEWVRHHAALALVELGPRAASARPAFEAALTDPNDYVRRLAKRALGGTPSK
jgi:HEAT repeat protein